MATIEITRHRSTFRNREDRFSLGNNEADGNAEMTEYTLPEGYSLEDDGSLIRDPAGIATAIVRGRNGGPVLMSRAGACPDMPLVPIET